MAGGFRKDFSAVGASGNKEAATHRQPYILTGDGIDPQAILTNPENFIDDDGNPLPEKGTPHPTNPTIFVDGYDVQQDGRVTKIVVLYSADGRFALPPVDEDDLDTVIGRRSWFERVTVRIPYAKRIKAAVPIVGPPQDGLPAVSTAYVWRLEYRMIPERRIVRAWDILIDERFVEQAEAAIEAQQGALHRIGGVWQKYEGSGLTPTGEKRQNRKIYQLTHAWTIDRGSLYPTNVTPGFWDDHFMQLWPINLLDTRTNTTPGWARPYWHNVTLKQSGSITDTPDADLVVDGDVGNRAIGSTYNGDGWKDLPGTRDL